MAGSEPHTEATPAEFLYGFVLAHFKHKLEVCYEAKRHKAKKLGAVDGVHLPSRRLLAVFVVAGEKKASLEETLLRTTLGADWYRDLDSADNALQQCVGTDDESGYFTNTLLHKFADGLEASSEQRGDLLDHCIGPASKGDLDMNRVASVYRTHAALVPATRPEPAIETDDNSEVHSRADQSALDYCVRSTARLTRLPPFYPDHLQVTELADLLTATELDKGWQREYGLRSGLYSGMTRYTGSPATELALRQRRSVFLGDPGHGKSTVLTACCLTAVADGRVALLVRLDDLGRLAAKHASAGLLHADVAAARVLDAAEATSGIECPPDTRTRVIEAILNDEETVLAFDGLDEIADQSGRAAAEKVLFALADIPGTITIASRVTGYITPLPGAAEMIVNQMTDPAVEEFVRSWFSADEKHLRDRTMAALDDSDLATLARIPLLAGFICYVSTHDEAETTKHGLYQQYLGLFFERRWKPTAQQRSSMNDLMEVLKLATAVAWVMAAWPNPDSEDPPTWMDHTSLRELASIADIPGDPAELTETDGLLIPHGKLRQGDRLAQQYRWLHRTIQEHLAGKALADWIRRDFDSAKIFLRTAALRPVWAVALEHCAGLLGRTSSTTKVVDYLFDLHISEDTINAAFASALTSFIACSGTTYRRKELAEEAFAKGHYSSALNLDENFTKMLLRENPPDPLKVGRWNFDRLGREYVLAQFDSVAKAAIREPRRYTNEWIEFLEILDKDSARRATVSSYINGNANYMHSILFEGLDWSEASWVIEWLPQCRSSYRLFKIADLINLVGGESARAELGELTSEWGAEGALIRKFYDGIDRRDAEGPDDVEDRALSFAFANLPQSDINELATGLHGRFLAAVAGASPIVPTRVPRLTNPWYHFGALLGKLRNDQKCTIADDENELDIEQVCALIFEVESFSDNDQNEDGDEARAEHLLRYHAAVERATEERILGALPPLLRTLDKLSGFAGYIDIPISNLNWLGEKLKRYSWDSFFEAYRSSSVAFSDNVETYFQIREIVEYHIFGEDFEGPAGYSHERLCQWIEWVVNNAGNPDLIDITKLHGVNPRGHADSILDIVHAGRNMENKNRVLVRIAQWIENEDELPRYQKRMSASMQ